MRSLTFFLCIFFLLQSFRIKDIFSEEYEETSEEESFVLLPESTLELKGHATLLSWDCKSNHVIGYALMGVPLKTIKKLLQDIESAFQEGRDLSSILPIKDELHSESIPQAWLNVPISSLNCGNRTMEHDLGRALKKNTYPRIIYILRRVDHVNALPEKNGTIKRFKAHLEGVLSVAGVERTEHIHVLIEVLSSGLFRISGIKRINMTDFNVQPPTAFFGLMRAYDPVDIYFDLVFQAQSIAQQKN